jgi:hypothetical protein
MAVCLPLSVCLCDMSKDIALLYHTIKNECGDIMKKSILFSILLCQWVLLSATSVVASDCSGGWSVLPNYNPGVAPCKQLGLDSRRGVCQPGQAYETLCDDMKGGRYRICQGPRPCGGGHTVAPPQHHQQQQQCQGWDYNYNQPCPRGYVNYDCRGGCEPRR